MWRNSNMACTHSYIPYFLFFFNDTPTTEIYTLSLHDALPISLSRHGTALDPAPARPAGRRARARRPGSVPRSEEHTSELQSHSDLVCRLLLEKKKKDDGGRDKPVPCLSPVTSVFLVRACPRGA